MDDNKRNLTDRARFLERIHQLATDEDMMLVEYSTDQLEMANAVIRKLRQRLIVIADVAQAGLGG